MDFNSIISEIGGGLPAVIIVGLAWAYWNERRRSDDLVERLIEQSQTHIADAAKREADTLSSLEKIVNLIGQQGGT